MLVPGSANPLLLRSAAAAATGISRSLRLNAPDSAYLSRTPASAGNRKTWTWAGWVKRSALSVDQSLFSAYTGSASDEAYTDFFFSSDNTLRLAGWFTNWRITTQVFRDVSAWFHIVLSVDIENSTANDRVKIYINGTQITTFSTTNNPATTSQFAINSTSAHNIGANVYYTNTTNKYSGYLTDIYFIDGQALTPSSFGEFSATTGVWNPKAYTGSYGSQGWHLEFADNSSNTATTLGKDTSGNSPANNWTPNNLSVLNGFTSVAAASGALPIYNTTDTYGTVKGSGTRTDANSSTMLLAVPMDGANGSTSFSDLSATIKGSGSNRTLSVTSTSITTSNSKYYGSSGTFSSGYITAPSSNDWNLLSSGNFTIEAWVYLTSGSSYRGIIACFGTSGIPSDGWYFRVENTNKLQFGGRSGGVDTTLINSSSSISLNTWNHVAAVRSGSTVILYINGISAASATATVGSSGGSNLSIGATYQAGGENWVGQMQDVRLYSSAKYTSNFNPPSSTQNPSIAAGNDSLVDVPTNGSQTDTGAGGEVRSNYATFNTLAGYGTLSNGNLDASSTIYRTGTIGVTSGKWYYEITAGSVVVNSYAGIYSDPNNLFAGYVNWGTGGYYSNVGGSNNFSSGTITQGDIIGVAFDRDNGTFAISRNGVSLGQYSGFSLGSAPWYLGMHTNASATVPWTINFGQRPFAYTAPSGFKALCTANLPAPLVTKPNTVFDVKLITANNSTQVISGFAFSPDLVWTKSRSQALSHYLYDTVRGAQKYLISNATNAETTAATTLDSFNSDGFTLGANDAANYGSGTGLAWCWDAGSSTVTNTQGSITSSVRANATAGFSIVTWTGNGASATVGHGLNVAPSMLIVKSRTTGNSWVIYHRSLGGGSFLLFDTSAAGASGNATWGSSNSDPTSTIFSVGSGSATNSNGASFVAYCFAPVVGYSAMGSFSGGSGIFTYTGFRPKWLLIKQSSAVSSWIIYDTSRDTYNVMGNSLYPNLSDAEISSPPRIDFVSNGFVTRASSGSEPSWTGTVIYYAIAESPFNYARAR